MVLRLLLVLILAVATSDSINVGRGRFAGEIVETAQGLIAGFVGVSRDGRDYYYWRKVPYARPPVGKLRFADPEPPFPWKGVRDGGRHGPWCPQVFLPLGNTIGNEDCLYLNVATPKLAYRGVKYQRKLPVIVYIHGGIYLSGGTDLFADPSYFMDEDVVFVSIAYRLGVLGFLTTGDEVVRGNMGLKDQSMALRWIKENIAGFGGDPDQVTLLGTSAGAASVHMHTLSKLSSGLFHRAISQSGVASNQWGLNPIQKSLECLEGLAKALNCPVENRTSLVQCLRSKDYNEIISTAGELFESKLIFLRPYMDGYAFVPTIEAVKDDRAFLAEHPLQIIAAGKANAVPHLFSHTSNEGILSSVDFRHDPSYVDQFEAEWEKHTRQLFQLNSSIPTDTVREIFELYVPPDKLNDLSVKERIEQYTAMLGDAFFNLDIYATVNLQRKFAPVYVYVYTRRNGPSAYPIIIYEVRKSWPKWLSAAYSMLLYTLRTRLLGLTPPNYGVDHTEDVFLLVPIPLFVNVPPGDAFYQPSKDHVRMMVDFAKDDMNVVVRGEKLPRLTADGPMKVLEINERTRIIQDPIEERIKNLLSFNIRVGYNTAKESER